MVLYANHICLSFMFSLELRSLIQSLTVKKVIIIPGINTFFFIIKINFGQFTIGSSIEIQIVNTNNKLTVLNIAVILVYYNEDFLNSAVCIYIFISLYLLQIDRYIYIHIYV